MHLKQHQRGITLFGLILIVALGGLSLSILSKLFSPYAEHKTIMTVVQDIAADKRILSLSTYEIRDAIAKRLLINNVELDEKTLRSIINIEKEPKLVRFTIDYEKRVEIFGNIDAVAVFNTPIEGNRILQ